MNCRYRLPRYQRQYFHHTATFLRNCPAIDWKALAISISQSKKHLEFLMKGKQVDLRKLKLFGKEMKMQY